MSNLPEAARATLDVLKGHENPFASLARPQRLDDRFLDLHVPDLLAAERKLVLQVIDRYRLEEYTRANDLPATRVVSILGERGAGKTHLLQSLSYREDGKSQILVRPSYYVPDVPFEEYLLSQLVAALIAEEYGSRPIEDIAAALTRRLLRQTFRALGPTDRIFALEPRRLRRWQLVLGGGERSCRVFDQLVEALDSPESSRDLPQLLVRHGVSAEQSLRLVQGHLRRFEVGRGALPLLRRELYTAMARAALFGDKEPLFRFLEGEYTQAADGSTRFDIVVRMLHAMTEVCALVRQPIVFAFDNLERLFSPQNHFDGELTRVFWSALAQAVDNTRGLLILLFAETGLFQKAAAFMDSFAVDRLQQGVPIHAQGPVSQIRLRAPTAEEIRGLTRSRVRPLLQGTTSAAELPDIFPFDDPLLTKEAAEGQNLRITLMRLRDQYSRLVYQQEPALPAGQAASPPPETKIPWEQLFDAKWKEHLTAAGRLASGSLAGQLQKIHAGLGSVLQTVLPLTVDDCELVEVNPTIVIGDNPNYGMISLLYWRGGNEAGNGAAVNKVGIAFLIGKGKGMSTDLTTKFQFFQRPVRGEELLILWPASQDADDLVTVLPTATRSVWDKSRHNKKTTLRRLETIDLAMLLAFPDWLNAVRGSRDEPPPQEVLAAFVKDRLQTILQLLAPPARVKEKVGSDED